MQGYYGLKPEDERPASRKVESRAYISLLRLNRSRMPPLGMLPEAALWLVAPGLLRIAISQCENKARWSKIEVGKQL